MRIVHDIFTIIMYNNMIQWTEYVFKIRSEVKTQYGVGKKLKNKEIINLPESELADKAGNSKKKKEWTKKRKVALAVVIGMVLATIAGVILVFVFDLGPIMPIKSTKEEAAPVGQCAGYEVRYEELRYITYINQRALDQKYGEYSTLSDEMKAEYEKELQSIVMRELENNYAILSLCEKYGVDTDSKEAKKFVNNSIEDIYKELGGKDEYKAWLKEQKLTDAFLRLTFKVNYLESALLEHLIKDGKTVKYNSSNLDKFVDYVMESEDYIKVIHIFFPKDESRYDFNRDPRSPKARAEEALGKLLAAESDSERFNVMRAEIGKAPFVQGYSVTGNDFYITHGQMNEKYDEVAFALDEYGVSEIIELDEGYYILMRVPKVRSEFSPRADELVEYYQYAVLKELVDRQKDAIAFTPNDYYKSLVLAEIK